VSKKQDYLRVLEALASFVDHLISILTYRGPNAKVQATTESEASGLAGAIQAK
jgi:hypothetical protein